MTNWLNNCGEAVTTIAKYMAIARYGTVPDLEDRVSDAQLAAVEAAATFEPRPNQDGIGYFLQYTFAQVAGQMRGKAQVERDESYYTGVLTDIIGDDWGVEDFDRLDAEGSPPEEILWRTKKGGVYTTTGFVDKLISEHSGVVARILNVDEGDAWTLHALVRSVMEDLADRPSVGNWSQDVPEPEPVVSRLLEPLEYTVRKNGTVITAQLTAEEATAAVIVASRGQAPWVQEQFDTTYEPTWNRDWAENAARPAGALRADETQLSERALELVRRAIDQWEYTTSLINEDWELHVLASKEWWGMEHPFSGPRPFEIGRDPTDFDVRKVLSPDSWQFSFELDEVMFNIADALEEEPDEACQEVAHLLTDELIRLGFTIWMPEDAREMRPFMLAFLRQYLGIERPDSAWEADDESADSLKQRAEQWLAAVFARAQQVDRDHRFYLWPSQMAAISALVLHGASPYEARQIGAKLVK